MLLTLDFFSEAFFSGHESFRAFGVAEPLEWVQEQEQQVKKASAAMQCNATSEAP